LEDKKHIGSSPFSSLFSAYLILILSLLYSSLSSSFFFSLSLSLLLFFSFLSSFSFFTCSAFP
jgi:hypothetical protein